MFSVIGISTRLSQERMARTVIIILSLATCIGVLMTLRYQVSSSTLRASLAAGCGMIIAMAVMMLSRRRP